MNPSDAVKLARYLRAHFPQQPIDEYTSEALAELLAPYPAEDCRRAVLNIAERGERWCSPTEVKAEVKRIRAKRIADHPVLVPPPGLSVAEELRWLGAARRRIGNGEHVDTSTDYGELVTGAEVNFRELLPTPTEETPA